MNRQPFRISVWSPKGGTGKTTASLSIAAGLCARGWKVQVVDLDPNGGSVTWSALAQALGQQIGFPVGRAEIRGDFEAVVYDHPPLNEPKLVGDVLVLPTLLDAASFRGFQDGIVVAKRQRKKVFPLANRYRSDRADQRMTLASLLPEGVATLRDRAVYPSAFSRGLTVYDPGQRLARLAQAELESLIDALAVHRLTQPYAVPYRKKRHELA